MIAPLFAELAEGYNGCFVKVDIDEAEDVAHKYSIRSMPTFVFLDPEKEGETEEIVRFSGCNKGKLEGLVKAVCAKVLVKGEKEEKREGEDKKKK